MRKFTLAALAAAALAIPSVASASEDFFDRLETEQRKMVAEMTMKLMKDAQKMGVPLTRSFIPGFIFVRADKNNDGVLDAAEAKKAEDELKKLMTAG